MNLFIGPVELGSIPRIAVPLLDDDVRGDIEAIRDLADIVELRIDSFADVSAAHVTGIARAARDACGGRMAIIATVRSGDEGGKTTLSDDERAALYDAAMPFADAVDVELRASVRDRVLASARRAGRRVVLSYHDFARMPPASELEEIVSRMHECGAAVVKIAAAAADTDDLLTLLELTLRHRHRDIVTMALGEHGTISRVFFPLAGSRITFGYHRTPSAPGQLPLRELHTELRRYYPAFSAPRTPA